MHRHFVGVAVLLALSGSLPAEEYQGATAILEKLHMTADGDPEDPARLLKPRIEAFQRESAKLAPEEAARKWLELFDAFADLHGSASLGSRRGRVELSTLIAALPPSSAWDALAKAVAARNDGKNPRRQVALELLVRILTGRTENPEETLALAKSVLQSPGGLRRMFGAHDYSADALAKLAAALQQRSGKPPRSLELFELQVAAADKGDDWELPRGMSQLPGGEALLTQALQKGLELEFPDETTRQWASGLVKARPELLRNAQWNLVASADDLPLYELMRQRFPSTENPWESREADQIYLAAQIAAGNHAAARKQVLQSIANENQIHLPPANGIGADGGKKLRAFLEELLSAAPTLPLWDTYFRLSAADGKSGEALAFLQKLHDGAEPGSRARRLLEDHLPQALLAAGSVDAGVEKLRAWIAAEPPENAATMNAEELAAMRNKLAAIGFEATPEQMAKLAEGGDTDDAAQRTIAQALQLAELGRLLRHPEWVREGLARATKAASLKDDDWGYTSSQIVTALLRHGRGVEAESLLARALQKMNRDKDRSFSTYGTRRTLGELAAVYRQAGRFDDIITLLDRCELWGAKDLADLNDVDAGEIPLQLAAAEAFFRQGRKDLALELARRVMRQHADEDGVYQLRLAIGEPDVEADLDRVFALNRFQERPLIWKAKWQLDAGRVADAEKTIRAAIAIDPSDGEKGKGDRMRAYAVLADVLEKKGDHGQAKIMRGAVRAVRLSEDADDWWQAGLLSRAVAMYEDALTHFADAYCIQSRLALRYSELGDLEKAEKHYQRAFELMPDSFGRIESHCFGCEGIFNSATSQNVAERIFTRLAKERPDSPQVFYLLGYLRQNQKRPEEAAAAFRRAVELDPDYVNAWKKLSELAEHSAELAKERDEAALALFRLTREEQAIRSVSDLPRLWDAILQAEENMPTPLKGPVYRLPAAGKEDDSEPRFYFPTGNDPSLAPREKFASNSIMSNVVDVIKLLLAKP